MKSRAFEYHRPESLEEAITLLARYNDEAKVLAGGQSLLPMMNFRLASPAHLIDINNISALSALRFDASGCRISATVRQRTVEQTPEIELSYPLVHRAISQVAYVQIRNRGTVCGSVAHADASAEMPSVMLALGAEMVALSTRGERVIRADEFFEFHLGTALESDELLTEVRLPALSPGAVGTFIELSRRAGDFALVGVGLQGVIGRDGLATALRIVCSGVAPVPLLLPDAAQLAIGTDLGDEVLLEVDHAVQRGVDPSEDVHATASYRRVVAGTLVRRGLRQLRDELRSADD